MADNYFRYSLKAGEFIESINKKYRLYMQQDGNLVTYEYSGEKRTPIWASETHNKAKEGTTKVEINGGELLIRGNTNGIFSGSENEILWNPHIKAAFIGRLENNGDFVLYDVNKFKVWSALNLPAENQVVFRINSVVPTKKDFIENRNWGEPILKFEDINLCYDVKKKQWRGNNSFALFSEEKEASTVIKQPECSDPREPDMVRGYIKFEKKHKHFKKDIIFSKDPSDDETYEFTVTYEQIS